jgi:uncharacterized protein (TIGR02391 family)
MFEAMKVVEMEVRRAGGFGKEIYGEELMRRAFDPDKGPLHNPSLLRSEQKGMADLYAGAMAFLRNPAGHRSTAADALYTASVIRLGDLLMRLIEQAKMRDEVKQIKADFERRNAEIDELLGDTS